MFRIDNSTAAPALPTPSAAGTAGYFTDGVPGSVPATVVPADWLNLVQEELAAPIVASGQALSKTSRAQLLQAIQNLPPGRLLAVRYFITGSYTYTPTPGTNSVEVDVQGGGGGGAGSPATGSGQTSLSGPGGSGTFARKRITSGFSGVTITVGAGGAAGAGGYGGSGGTSSFGSLVSAVGGYGGYYAGPTSAASYNVTNLPYPTVPTQGDLNLGGGIPGQSSFFASNSITQPPVQSRYGSSYGAGGYAGLPCPASSAATSGQAGGGGLVTVREYS